MAAVRQLALAEQRGDAEAAAYFRDLFTRSLFHLRCEVGAYRVQIVLLDPQAGCSCRRLQARCGAWVMVSVGVLSAHSG